MRSRSCSPPPVARPARISLRQGLHGPHKVAFSHQTRQWQLWACAVDATGALDPAPNRGLQRCAFAFDSHEAEMCRREVRMFQQSRPRRGNYEDCPRGG